MAKNFFKRYVWLITTIYRHKYITRADINRLWEHSQLNELHEKFSERISIIVNAMRDEKAVELTYQSFNREEPNSFEAHPWCLKLFRQRRGSFRHHPQSPGRPGEVPGNAPPASVSFRLSISSRNCSAVARRYRSCRPAGSARRWRKKSAGCFRRIVKIPTSDD